MIIDDILYAQVQLDERGKLKNALDANAKTGARVASYLPDEEEKKVRQMVINSFQWADVVMRKPRREWNDMSTLSRMMIDQLSFNIYQPNNGQGYEGDPTNAWKSHAMRPIVRNKVMSIAAHVTAQLLFPKLFAYDEQSEEQEDAATAMRDLMEWVSEQNDYSRMTLYSVINALVNPASILHAEYCKSYRTIKTEKVDGRWQTKEIIDEDNSGFKLTPVPVDELYIADFYTEDIQKQNYLIWRRVQTYEIMEAKYGKHPNFKYVKPGMQVIYNDANVAFYEVYDSNLRGSLCEEVIFYSKALDLQLYMVNGVLLCDYDNPNPRLDKRYPFISFGYENIDEGRSFYKKSLAFKMQPDADIINTLYPIIIDGTYLNTFSPMIISGEEEIGSDVMIPGMTTNLINPESSVTPLRVAQDIRQGMETLFKVEESINQSSVMPMPEGNRVTAYQISRFEQERNTLVGPFFTMLGSYVKQYGDLIISDILQHLTLPEVNAIIDNGELIYKTFIVNNRNTKDGQKSRKIKFDSSLPKENDEEGEKKISYDILEEQGGGESKNELFKVNPTLFGKLKYLCSVTPDAVTPMSDDLKKAFGLEVFDKSIAAAQVGVPVDMEEVYKDFVLKNYPGAKEDPGKYIKAQELQAPQIPGQPPLPPMGPGGGNTVATGSPDGQSPLSNMTPL